MANDRKAISMALLATLLWSTASTAFKIALQEYNYLQLLLVASYVSFLSLATTVSFQGKWKSLIPRSPKEIAVSVGLALLNPVAYYLVLFKAYSLLPAQIAQPLNYTWPLVLVFLSAPILKQKIRFKSYIALMVSFFGVIVISSQGDFSTLLNNDLTGVLLAAGSALIWAFFWLFSVMDKRDETVKLLHSFLFGSVFLTTVVLWEGHWNFSLGKSLWASIYVGLFEMGFTFVLWMKAMSYASSTDKIGNFVYLSPFLALVFISTILKEKILWTTFVGLFFIVGGIFIQKIKLGTSQNQ